jgi:hypothetical protein
VEQQLEGGNAGGAVLVDGTVRRPTGPWTPAVHALLRYLERRNFQGSPRVLGVDERGREILTYIPGMSIGGVQPWPAWVHSENALLQVGAWLRRYHDCVRDFVPPAGAPWRIGSHEWRPGDVVGHNDAAPYNAVWRIEPNTHTRLVGFIDWDFASPCAPVWDLAFTAFSWVPLHAREVVIAEGFTDFASRPRRLRMLLGAYGWTGTVSEVLDAVQARLVAHMQDVRRLADAGDPLFQQLINSGVLSALMEATRQLDSDRPEFEIQDG